MEFYIIKNTKNRKFVGVIESKKGLVACTVPNLLKEDIEIKLAHYAKKIQKMEYNIQENGSKFGEFIFKLDEDLSKFWSKALRLNLDFRLLTLKQKIVAETLRKLPIGSVISYGDLAKEAGLPNAARFVGNYMANNPLPLLIPCHRVIKSDGKLGEYSAGGLEVKKRYLLNEGFSKFK
ncbi:MAG: methylated-DNA--[protein]-cysteine S-methyltransferase [Candidatus Kariarchaeaceae archaeon]|jgi:O-6-methylguanine DNA methyltransferase